MSFTPGQRIRANELNRLGQLIGRNQRTTRSVLGTDVALVLSTSASVVAGRSYRITCDGEVYSANGAAVSMHEIRATTNGTEPTVSSPVIGRAEVHNTSTIAQPDKCHIEKIYDCTTSGTLRVAVTSRRVSGAVQVAWEAAPEYPMLLTIEDVGDTISLTGTVYGDGGSAPDPGGGGTDRPYFQAADWLWNKIPAGAVLDANSAAMINEFKTGSHIVDTLEYGVLLKGPTGIDVSTPRYNITFAEEGSWGPDPFGTRTMPIPNSVTNATLPTGGDKHLSVADPTTNMTFSLWVANKVGSNWNADWGAMSPLDGDGRETLGGSSVGAGIARYACVIRIAEITAGKIPHAIFFSTNMAQGPANSSNFRYPAVKTDGSNMSSASNPIPEGARLQLDPSIDLDALGLTGGQKTIAKCLQEYGAYCGDNGGARAAFICEYNGVNDDPWDAVGLGDYANLTGIPWASMRVLKKWDGTS